MPLQRYVSNELTHFVGRSRSAQEQYALVLKILRECWLTHPPHDTRTGGSLTFRPDAKFSTNEMLSPEIVCFCDIPVEDLGLHMQKYSRFGIALPKDLVIRAGGSPVRYIPVATEGAYFDGRAWQLIRHFIKTLNPPLSPQDEDERRSLFRFMSSKLLSFVKFYDHALPDDDPDNYYMEREWRVVGNVQFQLSDVVRVILPASFAPQFRIDLPEYCGQLSFAP